MQLRNYQINLKNNAYRSWQDGNRNVLLVSPTGSGKTVVMSSVAHEMTTPGVAIAHRTELVGQISLAMARMGIEHNVIGSKSTVSFCIQQQIAELGRNYYRKNGRVTVASVDTLNSRSAALQQWASQQRWWMTDECFVAGTHISTPTGQRAIEKLRVGDMVVAYNETDGSFVPRRVKRLFKKEPTRRTMIVSAGGRTVQCTQEHPFWTDSGWTRAGHLHMQHHRLLVDGRWCAMDRTEIVYKPVELVYNIEVDEHHTYVAEGIVVHNCHHLLSGNKWGKAVEMLPNAYGLGVTATPVRADRKSLHVDQGGVFHDMVVGPSMRDLIDQGALCDYRIFSLPQSIDTSTVKIGSTGDYSQPGLRSAAHDSKIVGDVVQHYLRFAKGLRGITFTVDVEQAIDLAKAFTDAGVPAMAVSAKTPDAIRAGAIQKFRAGEIMQLVNVDLFGEGFDVPAVEVVSMARPTMSYGLFVQQFGRALRTAPGKSHGIILDHVGNVQRHGLPDAPRQWSLYNENYGKRGKRDDDGVIPVTSCPECFAAYERVHKACPHCGHVPEPAGRSLPEQVDGDLIELDPSVLAEMRGEIDRIDGDAQVPIGADAAVTGAVKKRWRERQEAQQRLRDAIALWAGVWRDAGEDDSTIHRRFFLTFGTDVMTAQTLNAADAAQLEARVSGT